MALKEVGLRKSQVITELTRSTHGDLKAYIPVGQRAATEDPEFFAHLIAWNEKNGQVRDSKVALPVIFLANARWWAPELQENALAHLALLDPRNLLRAISFAKSLARNQSGMSVKRLVVRYLRVREENWAWWERTTLQHRASMKSLYGQFHVKPNAMAELILFKGEPVKGTVFEAVANLKNMTAREAAGTILERRIPFLVAIGALGAKAKEPDLVLALIDRMSPTELVTNTKMLERLGVRTDPALRAAFEEGLKKAAESKKSTFKTTRAAEAVGDETLKAKLRAVQEKQIQTISAAEGNWLVLGDKSGSMELSIETARLVAATLAKAVKGEVHLVFFDTSPRHIDATGKTYDEILAVTKGIRAGGGTSIGCGLHYALEKGLDFDGIAIVSDAEENQAPRFADVYKRMVERDLREVPVYLYRVVLRPEKLAAHKKMFRPYYLMNPDAEGDTLTPAMEKAGFSVQTFEFVEGQVDYYSLPNLIQTMRVSRYSLADQIMETPLLTLDQAFEGGGRREAISA